MAIIVEDGTAKSDAQSYATVVEADAHYDFHLNASAWTDATEAQKEAALVQATRLLDASVQWRGMRRTSTQALDWPRVDVVVDGYDVAIDVIPGPVKTAAMELCRYLLASDRALAQDTPAIKRQKVDVLEREFFEANRPDLIPDEVLRIVRRYCVATPAQNSASGVSTIGASRA